MKREPASTLSNGRAEAANRFFTISNLLSILRVVLVIPFAFVMLRGGADGRLWGAIIMVLAALTDKYDGVLARKYGQTTEWGKILDPFADKLGLAVAAVVLLILGSIPLWFVIVLVLRDVLILSGGMYLRSKKGVVLQSNETGKWTVGIVSLTVFLMVLNAQSVLVDIFMWAGTILLVVSSSTYLRRFLAIVKG